MPPNVEVVAETSNAMSTTATNTSSPTTVEAITPPSATSPRAFKSPHGIPCPQAPYNVFTHQVRYNPQCEKGWTNTYDLPVEYTVELYQNLLDIKNDALATRFMPEERRRFIVVDEAVMNLYGDRIESYFKHYDIPVKIVTILGEEENKTFVAVEKILEELCEFGLHRREPILAIGGGVVLDIVGFTASMYRRGVPYIRVPTTLLAIVDASVGVKTGVDYVSKSKGPLKNRVGAFYAPIAAFLDKSFIRTQDERNLINGMGEIMKLALIKSPELFSILEKDGARLIREKFQGKDRAADRVIELSIQMMLEELGPNLWEFKLERCVDYGHSFSKIIEFVATPALMHGEAVNIDGFFCIILSHRRKWISTELRDHILQVMLGMNLPVVDKCMTQDVMCKALADAIEHRNGAQRMPLVRNAIGQCDFANDITPEEVQGALNELFSMCKKFGVQVERCTIQSGENCVVPCV